MQASTKRRLAAPCLEPLEGRLLLDGNVLATVVKGALTIRGDAASNAIELTYDYDTGQYTITGQSNTLVNGQAAQTLKATGNVSINMGAGDDAVTMTDVFVGDLNAGIRRHITANLGAGNDSFSLIGSAQAMDLKVIGGEGNNAITIGGGTGTTRVWGNVSLSGGRGDDTFTIVDAAIGKNLAVSAGQGNNKLSVGSSTHAGSGIYGNLSFSSGSGVDEVSIAGGDDGSGVITSANVFGKCTISTGAGNDKVEIYRGANIFGATSIAAGAGNNEVNLGYANMGTVIFFAPVTLSTGAGTNTLGMANATFVRPAKFTLGGGNDAVTMNTCGFNDSVTLDGGGGSNWFSHSDDNIFVVPPVFRRLMTAG